MRAREFTAKLNESLRKGEYHLWTVHFEDGGSTKVRVSWDETSDAELQRHFKDRKIVKVDRDYAVHGETPMEPTRHYWTGQLMPENTQLAEGADFGTYYSEKLAQTIFDQNPNLSTEGRADELVDAGYAQAAQDLGRQRAGHIFNYDEDFPSDFVSAYSWLKKNQTDLLEFLQTGGGNGNDGFSEDTLKMLAAQWWNGNEDSRVETLLRSAGWEIGQDEGYDNGGVFVVQSGDEQGHSFLSWPADELEQISESKTRLDPRCWKGWRKQGTKMKGGVRVNNCVKVKK